MSRDRELADDAQSGESTRRSFLKAATTATVAGAGLVGATGQAAALSYGQTQAPDGYPIISTRDHFNSDAELINGETATSYQIEGDWDASEEWGYTPGDELVIWVHGFHNADKDAILLPQGVNAGYETDLALQQNGYDEFVTTFSWDADKGRSLDLGWADAKNIANRNGKKLANFIMDWNAQRTPVGNGEPVRIVAHSLGARVIGETLAALRDNGASNAVEEVALLGAAIDRESVSWGDQWYDPIEYATKTLNNYYSHNDGILDYVYDVREWGDALGQEGIGGWAPDNYDDTNVSSDVSTHLQYYKPDDGCMATVASDFKS